MALTAQIYQTYTRIPDRKLARETWRLIDAKCPVAPHSNNGARDRDSEWNGPDFLLLVGEGEPSKLSSGLDLATTADDWRELLTAVKAGQWPQWLLRRELIVQRLAHDDPLVRQRAIILLAAANTPDSWADVAAALKDDRLRGAAAKEIVRARYVPFFAAALEADAGDRGRQPDLNSFLPFSDAVLQNIGIFTDEEMRKLLAEKHPLIDWICLKQIAKDRHLDFLPEALQILNRGQPSIARDTIKALFAGLDVWGVEPLTKYGEDPLRWLIAETSLAPLHTLVLTPSGKRTQPIIQDVVRCAKEPHPKHWEKLRELALQWQQLRGAELWSAAFIEAMHQSDRARTERWLLEALAAADPEDSNTSHFLGGAGTIADPKFLPAVEAFSRKAEGHLFGTNSYYTRYLHFALHRCRQIHRWQLTKDADGRWVVDKSASDVDR